MSSAQAATISKDANLFAGRSLLRADEKKPEAPKNTALQDYLKKYADSGEGKKKKKKRKEASATGAITILDSDLAAFEAPVDASAAAKRRAMRHASEEGSDAEDEGGCKHEHRPWSGKHTHMHSCASACAHVYVPTGQTLMQVEA